MCTKWSILVKVTNSSALALQALGKPLKRLLHFLKSTSLGPMAEAGLLQMA